MSNLTSVSSSAPLCSSYEESKQNIMLTLQNAVKQIQSYSSLHDSEECLTLDLSEVLELCDALDKLLFHGLKEYQQGYWPYVKDFTHSDSVAFINKLGNASSDVQKGRAWLCIALNECALESYFQSFIQNPSSSKKYYVSAAAMRDNQNMQVVIMLLASLENIPISLKVKQMRWGSGLLFCSNVDQNEMISSGDLTQTGSETPVSFHDSDSGVIEYENAFEANKLSPIDLVIFTKDKNAVSHNVVYSLPHNEIERITKYINIDLDSEKSQSSDLEVIRAKVTRRVKKQPSQINEINQTIQQELPLNEDAKLECSSDENDCKRFSKATTDSGLCLESHSPVESNSPDLTRTLSFDMCDFRKDLNVVFSTPKRGSSVSNDTAIDESLLTEERGVPEGQEDPSYNSSKVLGERFAFLSPDDSEFSIYDKYPGDKSGDDVQSETDEDFEPDLDNVDNCKNNEDLKIVPVKVEEDPVALELAELAFEQQEDRIDFHVDDNTLLYLLCEVYESDDETFYKMFSGYLNFPKGKDELVLFLLTDKSVYILKPGLSDRKLSFHDSFFYRNIGHVTVSLNYQGFTIVSKKQRMTLYTADEVLTRSILSSLEVIIRRNLPVTCVPNVHTDATTQQRNLRKFLAGQFTLPPSEIEVDHFVLARWGDYVGNDFPVSPAGPIHEGFLMYRQHYVDYSREKPWCPGFFLLKGCVLYCMTDEHNKSPLFFIHMYAPHCRGCRRLHLPKRPYAFEVILSNGDTLQLAAANEDDASLWQQAFLQAVSLAGHFIASDYDKLIPCCIIISNDHVVAAKEITGGYVKVLGVSCISNLVDVYCDSNLDSSLMMEFELVEAGKSCGEWMIVFETENEKTKFLEVLKYKWSLHSQVDFKTSMIKDLSLVRKLQHVEENSRSLKQKLKNICLDS